MYSQGYGGCRGLLLFLVEVVHHLGQRGDVDARVQHTRERVFGSRDLYELFGLRYLISNGLVELVMKDLLDFYSGRCKPLLVLGLRRSPMLHNYIIHNNPVEWIIRKLRVKKGEDE